MRTGLTRSLAPEVTLALATLLVLTALPVRAAQVAEQPHQGLAARLKRWKFRLRRTRVTAVPGDSWRDHPVASGKRSRRPFHVKRDRTMVIGSVISRAPGPCEAAHRSHCRAGPRGESGLCSHGQNRARENGWLDSENPNTARPGSTVSPPILTVASRPLTPTVSSPDTKEQIRCPGTEAETRHPPLTQEQASRLLIRRDVRCLLTPARVRGQVTQPAAKHPGARIRASPPPTRRVASLPGPEAGHRETRRLGSPLLTRRVPRRTRPAVRRPVTRQATGHRATRGEARPLGIQEQLSRLLPPGEARPPATHQISHLGIRLMVRGRVIRPTAAGSMAIRPPRHPPSSFLNQRGRSPTHLSPAPPRRHSRREAEAAHGPGRAHGHAAS
jgi:hypothetical protein